MLRFFKNGVDQGVAFRDLPLDTPLYAAVNLGAKDRALVYNVRNTIVSLVFNLSVNLVRE